MCLIFRTIIWLRILLHSPLGYAILVKGIWVLKWGKSNGANPRKRGDAKLEVYRGNKACRGLLSL